MTIAFVKEITPWSVASGTANTAFTYTNAGDIAAIYVVDGSGNSKTITVTGTGTYNIQTALNPATGMYNDTQGDTHAIAVNSSTTTASQTITLNATAADSMWGFGIEYSGVSTFSTVAGVQRSVANGGTISGTGVVVPTGGILLAFFANVDGLSGALTISGGGTSRDSGTNSGVNYAIGEWAGSGGSITPTCTATTASDNVVVQLLMSPSGGDVLQSQACL